MNQFNANKDHDERATFIVKVKFRQNSTWQGELKWVDKNKVHHFKSELEMLKYMDEALNISFDEKSIVKWK